MNTLLSIEKVQNMVSNCNDCLLVDRVRAQPILIEGGGRRVLVVGPNYGDFNETHKAVSRFFREDWIETRKFDYVQAVKCGGSAGYASSETCALQTQNYALTYPYCGFIAIGKLAHQQFDPTMAVNRIEKTNSGTPMVFLPSDPEKVDWVILREFFYLMFSP